jgi:hypothetical protein
MGLHTRSKNSHDTATPQPRTVNVKNCRAGKLAGALFAAAAFTISNMNKAFGAIDGS